MDRQFKVMDRDGEPVSGANVYVLKPSEGPTAWRNFGKTDDEGGFTVAEEPEPCRTCGGSGTFSFGLLGRTSGQSVHGINVACPACVTDEVPAPSEQPETPADGKPRPKTKAKVFVVTELTPEITNAELGDAVRDLWRGDHIEASGILPAEGGSLRVALLDVAIYEQAEFQACIDELYAALEEKDNATADEAEPSAVPFRLLQCDDCHHWTYAGTRTQRFCLPQKIGTCSKHNLTRPVGSSACDQFREDAEPGSDWKMAESPPMASKPPPSPGLTEPQVDARVAKWLLALEQAFLTTENDPPDRLDCAVAARCVANLISVAPSAESEPLFGCMECHGTFPESLRASHRCGPKADDAPPAVDPQPRTVPQRLLKRAASLAYGGDEEGSQLLREAAGLLEKVRGRLVVCSACGSKRVGLSELPYEPIPSPVAAPTKPPDSIEAGDLWQRDEDGLAVIVEKFTLEGSVEFAALDGSGFNRIGQTAFRVAFTKRPGWRFVGESDQSEGGHNV